MGPVQKAPSQAPQQIKINHQKFQKFNYNQSTDHLQITLDIQNQRDITQWTNNIKRTNQFQDKENLLLPQKHQFSQKGFCGNAGICKISYENYPYLFEEEIQNRIEMNKHFQEEEVWYLLYSLVCSAQDFNRLNLKIGDVRPYNIFINEEGQIKIANLFSWPYERTNFEKTSYEKTLTYVAPEQIKLINKGMQDTIVNRVTAQSFSIGLTVLQSGLLFNAKELYSVSRMSFDEEMLNRKVMNWHHLEFNVENEGYRKYSPLLRNIVAGMCNPDDRERLGSLQVQEMLRPYANQILNLKEFDTRAVNLPFKNIVDQQQPDKTVYYQQNNRQQSVQSPTRYMGQSQERPQPQARPLSQQPRTQSQFKQPQAPLIMPQQTVVVNRIEPKTSSEYRSVSPNVKFSGQNEGIILGGRQAGRDTGKVAFSEMRTQQVPLSTHEQQFHRYAANQPEPVRVTRVENNGPAPFNYEQQFHKYSAANHTYEPRREDVTVSNTTTFRNTTTNVITSSNSNNALNFNGQSYNPSPKIWQAPPAPTTTTSQFAPRPYSSIQASTNVVSSISGPSNDNGSDFLRRIDQQLQASRKQFPSS